MQLKLINNLTKNIIELGEVKDKLISTVYYVFDIYLPTDVADGEYTYELYDGENMVSAGLLQIGDYVQDNKEYKETKKDYIVYE